MVSTSLLALNLITVTTTDGRKVEINPDEIVSFRAPASTVLEHVGAGVKCMVFTADGKFIGVKETCDQISKMLSPQGQVSWHLNRSR